jgi:hypothetical protein
MKYTFFSAALILLFSCNQTGTDKTPVNDSLPVSAEDTLKPVVVNDIKPENDSTLVLGKAKEILTAVKNKDYQGFAAFIHPGFGTRFSPYTYIDTVVDKRFSAAEFTRLLNQNKKINWNSAWADDTEMLTVKEYFAKYVYDVDFMKAEIISLNKFHSQGSQINNINEVYPLHYFVEYFFSGFEKKYEGMDFKGLRLVFKMHEKRPYLIGVVHDQWMP